MRDRKAGEKKTTTTKKKNDETTKKKIQKKKVGASEKIETPRMPRNWKFACVHSSPGLVKAAGVYCRSGPWLPLRLAHYTNIYSRRDVTNWRCSVAARGVVYNAQDGNVNVWAPNQQAAG